MLPAELDGFEGRPGVLLLAATNRPGVLDSALMRPGRLSRKVRWRHGGRRVPMLPAAWHLQHTFVQRLHPVHASHMVNISVLASATHPLLPPQPQVTVPLPDESARAAILGVHLRRVPLASQHERELACEAVAKITSGGLVGLWVDR